MNKVYLYYGVFCYSDPEKNRKQRLKSFGFTDQGITVGAIIYHQEKTFKILVKETYDRDDCANTEPLSVELLEPFVKKTKTGYKIIWDKTNKEIRGEKACAKN